MSNLTSEKRVPSERELFERWLARYEARVRSDIIGQRSEYGYEIPEWDLAFAAWKARGDRRRLCRRTI